MIKYETKPLEPVCEFEMDNYLCDDRFGVNPMKIYKIESKDEFSTLLSNTGVYTKVNSSGYDEKYKHYVFWLDSRNCDYDEFYICSIGEFEEEIQELIHETSDTKRELELLLSKIYEFE